MYKIIGNSSAKIKVIMITALMISTICFSKEVSDGIYKGIYFCAEILVPSIFPFMVVSALTAKSELSFSGRIIGKIFRSVFGLSEKTAVAVLIGVFGGYPVGARAIGTLYKEKAISEKEAVIAAYTAVGAGPGFLITFIGIKLLHSFEAGIVLLISQFLSVIIIAIINRIIFGKENYISNNEYKRPRKAKNIFIESVSCAVYATIEMCAMVCVFSAFSSVIEKYLGNHNLIYILLEVTRACLKLSENSNLLFIAFAVGFGGICVHFQIFQALGNIRINKLLFFLYRIIQGLITAFFTYILTKLFNITIPVFSNTKGNFPLGLSSSVLGSTLLIITGFCFLYSIHNNKLED